MFSADYELRSALNSSAFSRGLKVTSQDIGAGGI